MRNEEATVARPLDTFFDSPARTGNAEIDQTHEALRSDDLLRQILEGIADPAVVLEHRRQIVLVNSAAIDLFQDVGTFDAIGRRIGEAIQCIHAEDMPAGCGTSRACATCGVAAAIRSTNTGMKRNRQDARVTIQPDGQHKSLDVRAITAELTWEGKPFTLVTLKDISDENRRRALERVFFHDVLNTAGAVSGLATLIPDTTDPAELSELHAMLQNSSEQLVHEIKNQRDLVEPSMVT
jgi:PAS domain-containing protein